MPNGYYHSKQGIQIQTQLGKSIKQTGANVETGDDEDVFSLDGVEGEPRHARAPDDRPDAVHIGAQFVAMPKPLKEAVERVLRGC